MSNETETERQRQQPFSMGDTAAASDLQWMVNEFGFGGTVDETTSTLNLNADNVTFGEILRQQENAAATEVESPNSTNCKITDSGSLSRTLDEEELLVLASTFSLQNDSQKEQRHHDARNSSTQAHYNSGPNEQLYVQNYQRGVLNRIQEHRRRHPKDLPIYSLLSDAEKLKEQQRVLRLLQRLKIAEAAELDAGLENNRSTTGNVTSNYSQPDAAAKESPLPNPHENGALEVDDNETNASELLLSPPAPANSSLLRFEGNDENTQYPQPDHAGDNSFDSTQSMEQTRAAPFYDSPASSSPNHKKRLATTSGKRGADAARLRMFHYYDNIDNDDEPSLLHSIGRLSLHDDGNVFAASQSPISEYLTHSPLRQRPMDEDSPSSSSAAFSNLSNPNRNSNYHEPDVSFGRDDSSIADSTTISNDHHSFPQNEAMSPNNDTLVETSVLPGKMVRWDFDGTLVKNAPTDVRLATGQVLNYAKLPVHISDRRHNSSSNKTNKHRVNATSFPDPFEFYNDNAKLQRRLYRLYGWVLRRDQAAHTKEKQQQHWQSACAVLSIELEHIVDLVLKLALEYPADDNDGGAIQNDNPVDAMLGQTLVVARTKEEVEIFGRAFREHSSYSVLDHSVLPLKDRKSQTTARRAAQFDVVLTTYDALKALDATITVDERGHAVHRKHTSQDGWYSSKNSGGGGTSHQDPGESVDAEANSSETVSALTLANKQFSVLHGIVWRRVIFVDELGRKCFLSKAGTARVAAATALSARSRLAFLVGERNTKRLVKGFKALKQSNKTALSSLAAVLRLSMEDEASELKQNIVDFVDKAALAAAGN